MSIQENTGKRNYNPVNRTFFRTFKPRPKEKHPVIDTMHTLVNRANADLKDLSENANVSKATYKNWFDGDTLQPQFQTLSRTLAALGYEFQIVPIRNKVNGKIKAAEPEIVWRKNQNN